MYQKIRFTFQEYFQQTRNRSETDGASHLQHLLGAYNAQIGFGLPSIGGKDSMSGTFNDIDVPPTLVSFAVDIASDMDVITPELKKAGNVLVICLILEKDENDLPDIPDRYMPLYDTVTCRLILADKVRICLRM